MALMLTLVTSCQQPGGNDTGSEYMPDMSHSIAYEANTYGYYSLNRWGTEEEYYNYALPRGTVEGTIPRTSSKLFNIPALDSRPYAYGDTEEERTRATAEIIDNPYPITTEGLARGKSLYDINCGLCHGEKGDGAGYLVRDDGGKYPVQPANLLLPDFVSASNGRMYHAIVYGKNLMGGYSDKLNYEERWQVIHYIRALQAKELKAEYSQMANTLNSIEKPAGADYKK